MVRGESAAPHLSCYSPVDGAWRSPHAPPVVFFSYRGCVVSLSRPTCRIFLSSIVRGVLPAPHLLCFSPLVGSLRDRRTTPLLLSSHRCWLATLTPPPPHTFPPSF